MSSQKLCNKMLLLEAYNSITIKTVVFDQIRQNFISFKLSIYRNKVFYKILNVSSLEF